MNVIGKYTHTTDRAMLEETQRVYASAFERVPYPDVEDMKLGITQVSETNPRAKGADPKDFVDPPLAARDRGQRIRQAAVWRRQISKALLDYVGVQSE